MVLFHFEGNGPLKCAFCGFLNQFMMERILSNICFAVFTANLLKRVLWNSARSHLLHTITLAICGFRNLRYFARSQNQQIAGFYCTHVFIYSIQVHVSNFELCFFSSRVFVFSCQDTRYISDIVEMFPLELGSTKINVQF